MALFVSYCNWAFDRRGGPCGRPTDSPPSIDKRTTTTLAANVEHLTNEIDFGRLLMRSWPIAISSEPEKHRRRSIRLKDYDYAQAGAYFVTVCTQDRIFLFGDVRDECMCRNAAGQMVVTVWDSISVRFPEIALDAFVVMPNHVHGIIVLPDSAEAPLVAAQPSERGATCKSATTSRPRLGEIVGTFKSLVTVEYVHGVKASGWQPFRQRLCNVITMSTSFAMKKS